MRVTPAMGSGRRASSRKNPSWSSWRSLLDSCLGATKEAGANILASDELGQQPPFVTGKDHLPSAPPPVASNSNLHAFTFAELSAATGGFAPGNKIGQGGFGTVYRGIVEDGVRTGLPAQPVAVKRARADDHDVEELLEEAMFLAQLQPRHPSLVKMIGHCCEGRHRLLVYELMGHGSLDDYISKPTRSELPWSTRLSIALATANGLASLHSAEKPLICAEFSASHVLLDSDNSAKISLSNLRLNTRASNGTAVSPRLVRYPRGWAPEYIMSGHSTEKSDVYSFGVVLLEILITGLKSVDMRRRAEERNLVEYARPRLKNARRLARIMDEALKGKYPVAAARKAALLVYKCLRVKPERRPDMSEVVEALDLLTSDVVGTSVAVG